SMSSSSSDTDSDEDLARYREACDPILSKAFNESTDLQQSNGKHVENPLHNGSEEISNTDHRQSFLLLSKIQQSLKYQENLPLPKGSLYQRKSASKQKNCSKESSQPSYLARQLSSILDQNIDFSKKTDDLEKNESEKEINNLVNGESRKAKNDFPLLHSVFLSKTDDRQQTSQKTKQRKYIKYSDNLDEKSMSNRCRNLAVSPEWILQKQGVYPWPHPKNIRYLDRYKVKKKHANGKTILTPINALDCQGNSGSINEMKTTNQKVKVKSSLSVPVNKKSDGADLKSNLEIQSKKRKQSRKRGGKKKKNEQSTD
ncbi:unnamed protein product, partial [Meganyctiphanes norvegica]